MPTVRMICLANSRKRSGRCVAGLRLDGGGWVRPVSRCEYGTLMACHTTLDTGQRVRTLDVVDVDLGPAQPQRHHPEDWALGPRRWRFVRRASAEDEALLLRHLATGPELIDNYCDRVAHGTAVTHSLTLLKMRGLRWRIEEREDRRKARAVFFFHEQQYKLVITDPELEARLGTLAAGDYPLEAAPGFRAGQEVLMTVSLSEPFAFNAGDPMFCYKLAVTILPYPLETGEGREQAGRFERREATRPRSPARLNPKEEAFLLFNRGLPVAEVAIQIGRAVATTCDYLEEYLRHTRKTAPHPWVDAQTFERIAGIVRQQGAARLKPIFEALGGEVPYEQIRLCVACLRGRQ